MHSPMPSHTPPTQSPRKPTHTPLLIANSPQFWTMLEPWNWPLFGPICKLQPTNSILNTTMKKEPILLLSDAMVQKKKQSGFAWVISHHAQPLWKGIGLALGHASEIYSRRAEAFGLLAGLTFLQHYISKLWTQKLYSLPNTMFLQQYGSDH